MGCSHPPIDTIRDDIGLSQNNPYRHVVVLGVDKHVSASSYQSHDAGTFSPISTCCKRVVPAIVKLRFTID